MHRNSSIYLMKNQYLYHILAIVSVSIWGLTFISTKVLLAAGLSAEIIFFYRFLMAYVCMIAIDHKRLFADNRKDEFMLLLCGITGGSLYFVTENTALALTFASNVSLIICTAPLFTMLFARLSHNSRQPLPVKMVIGAFIALLGVGAVVFTPDQSLQFNPLGDILTLAAAILWAVYCVLLKSLGNRYSAFFLTRKVFFYGVLTISIYLLFGQQPLFSPTVFRPTVLGNLIFLGIGASLLCYLMWNVTVKKLGAQKASNYLYLIPLVTVSAAAIILAEPVTPTTIAGSVLIIGGVFLAEK